MAFRLWSKQQARFESRIAAHFNLAESLPWLIETRVTVRLALLIVMKEATVVEKEMTLVVLDLVVVVVVIMVAIEHRHTIVQEVQCVVPRVVTAGTGHFS